MTGLKYRFAFIHGENVIIGKGGRMQILLVEDIKLFILTKLWLLQSGALDCFQ